MSTIVFAGPTIPPREIEVLLDCTVLPPAAVGDVLRATRADARTIVLIDGIFERVPPVWHKEILWALTQGVQVWGAASMGALRAAELHSFGMRGVGRIFEAYRNGDLEADDEVAVLHGPAEVGYAPVTEALVNFRATLEAAESAKVLSSVDVARTLAAARAIHYRQRTWETILDSVDSGVADRLRAWLPVGRVDRKRLDALELLDEVGAFLAGDPAPFRPGFAFAWTDAWDVLFQAVGVGSNEAAVLDELRLRGDAQTVGRAALLRVLALAEVERAGLLPAASIATARERLRARLGLWCRAELERWLAVAELTEQGFAALCREEAAIATLLAERRGPVGAASLAELRLGGTYPALAERARDKARRLAAAGVDELTAAAAGVDLAPELARLAGAIGPDGTGEPEDLARWLGFADRADLEQALLREVLYLRMMRANKGGVA
jgi:hypothetical protein